MMYVKCLVWWFTCSKPYNVLNGACSLRLLVLFLTQGERWLHSLGIPVSFKLNSQILRVVVLVGYHHPMNST